MTTKKNKGGMCEVEFRHCVQAKVAGWDYTLGETYVRAKCKTKKECLEIFDRFLPRTVDVEKFKKDIEKKTKPK